MGGDDPMDVAEELGHFASDPMISRPVNEESDLAAHQPGIDHLVLAGLLPLKQGSQNALDGENLPTTSRSVPQLSWAAAPLRRYNSLSPHGLDDVIERRLVLVRAGLAVARHRATDDATVQGFQAVVVKPLALPDPRPEVVVDDIDSAHQLVERLAPSACWRSSVCSSCCD